MRFLPSSHRILSRFYKNPEQNLKLLLAHHLDREDALAPSDRQAAVRTVYGVVRQDLRLEFLIGRVSNRKLHKIHPAVLVYLKIGIYLLLFSDSYPAHAVLNEVVSAAGGKVRGFVNALLRNIQRQGSALLSEINHTTDYGLRFGMPLLVVENLRRITVDPRQLDFCLNYLNCEPLFHLRAGKRAAETEAMLTKAGIEFTELEKFQSFQLKEAAAVISELQTGLYFQNTASQLIAVIAARYAGETLLDACAAPGTKAVTAALLNPGLRVTANDLHPGRARLIKLLVSQLGLRDRINITVSDASLPAFGRAFDFILVDAPCSSAGTLRKNPDLKLKLKQELVERNAALQVKILRALLNSSAVRSAEKAADLPGVSYVLYAVCSFLYEETEAVVSQVLASLEPGSPFVGETTDLSMLLTEYGFKFKKATYGFYLLPDGKLNNDLFYFALLPVGCNFSK